MRLVTAFWEIRLGWLSVTPRCLCLSSCFCPLASFVLKQFSRASVMEGWKSTKGVYDMCPCVCSMYQSPARAAFSHSLLLATSCNPSWKDKFETLSWEARNKKRRREGTTEENWTHFMRQHLIKRTYDAASDDVQCCFENSFGCKARCSCVNGTKKMSSRLSSAVFGSMVPCRRNPERIVLFARDLTCKLAQMRRSDSVSLTQS